MRKLICKQCKEEFFENDDNPAIHYSTPSEICPRCESKNWIKPLTEGSTKTNVKSLEDYGIRPSAPPPKPNPNIIPPK